MDGRCQEWVNDSEWMKVNLILDSSMVRLATLTRIGFSTGHLWQPLKERPHT